MPQVEQVRKRLSKPIVWGIGALVVAVAVVMAVLMMPKSQPTADETNAVLDTAADKMFTGDAAGAIVVLTDQLAKVKTDDEKLSLYMALGSAYEEKKDNAEALKQYQKADAIRPGFGINASIARAAEAAGDTALAIEYHQKNRALIKDGSDKLHSEELPGVEEAIVRLGGTL